MRARRLPVGFEIDLIPVMSLIVHIIPMLLLGIRFATLSVVPTGGPVVPVEQAPGAELLEQQDEKVVSVRITPEGFVVGGSGAADPRIPCRGTCAADTYDYRALTEAMLAAKTRLPAERRVVIVPHPALPFEVVVRVMDATRSVREVDTQRDLFPVPLLAAESP